MTPDEFQKATLGQLEVLTGIDRHRWSRYLSGKVTVNEKTLSAVASKLGMTPSQLLEAILKRRLHHHAAIEAETKGRQLP